MEKCGGQDTHDNRIRRVRFACWITMATYMHAHTRTHTVYYVILIALPRRERASVLRYTCIILLGVRSGWWVSLTMMVTQN
jgi:hypothetical protein